MDFRSAVWPLLTLLLLGASAREGKAFGEEGFKELVGKDLDSWVVEGAHDFKEGGTTRPIWVARDGMIRCLVNKNSYGFLRYQKQEFGDFVLRVEYRFAAPGPGGKRGNSGVGIRTVPYDPKQSDR